MDKKSMMLSKKLDDERMKENAPRGRGRPKQDAKMEDKKKDVRDMKDVKDKKMKKEDKKEVRDKSPPKSTDKSSVMKDLKLKLKEVEKKQRETDKSLKRIENEIKKM